MSSLCVQSNKQIFVGKYSTEETQQESNCKVLTDGNKIVWNNF